MGASARVVARVMFRRPTGVYWGVGLGGLEPAKWHKLDLRTALPGDIEFELSSGAIRSGYRFDTDDPIWVHADTDNCPPPGSSHPDIEDIRPTPTRVRVYNAKRSGRVSLRYQLNVLDGNNRPKPIDPIIEN